MKTCAILLLMAGILRAEIPWEEIRSQAEEFVRRESPPDVWPFENPAGLPPTPRKVFAHFFVPFPLSFDNKPAGADYYEKYLDPFESDRVMAPMKFYTKGSGGYIRQRPLPVGPWATAHWEELNYAIEILRAKAAGIDGFAVDILQEKPGAIQYDRVVRLMETASHVAPEFSLMLMPDAAAGFRNASPEQAAEALLPLARSPSAFRLDDGRVVIAPFKANGRTPDFWKQTMDLLERSGVRTAFLPVFLFFENLEQNAAAFSEISFAMSDWGFRDRGFAEKLGLLKGPERVAPFTPLWMMPVAPQDFRSKDLAFNEAENTRAFRYMWDGALKTGSRYVQLITWNDYSEATEIAPSTRTQFLFYDLTAYYAAWFKTGQPPAILRDAIFYCHREHILPVEGLDPARQRANFQRVGETPVRNDVEMLAFLTAPAELEIEQNGQVRRSGTKEAGLQTFAVPAEPGTPIFRIMRAGRCILEMKSRDAITGRGTTENPLYGGGSSTREPQAN